MVALFMSSGSSIFTSESEQPTILDWFISSVSNNPALIKDFALIFLAIEAFAEINELSLILTLPFKTHPAEIKQLSVISTSLLIILLNKN